MMQIGANDLCQLCLQSLLPGPADDFEEKIREVLEYLRVNLRAFSPSCYYSWTYTFRRIANTIVNLTGVFKLSGLYKVCWGSPARCHPTDPRSQLTRNQPYCDQTIPFIRHFNWECSVRHFFPSRLPDLFHFQCALLGGDIGKVTRRAMDELQAQYNDRLLKIVSDYQRARDPRFAVTWIGAEIPLHEYPIEALSNVDCFHPSLDSHRFIAAGMWNRLTGDKTTRSQPFAPWTRDLTFRCLEAGDRIITDALIR